MAKTYIDKPIPFGKFKGTLICDCSDNYLNYLLDQDWFCLKFKDLLELVKMEIKYRKDFDIKI
jgi:uncharacterized protein (DUF3820 family)